MDEVTIALGQSLRDFQEKTCSAYDTKELLREAGARRKRQAKAAAPQSSETVQETNLVPEQPPNTDTSNPVMGAEQNLQDINAVPEEPLNPNPTMGSPPKPPATKKRKRATKKSVPEQPPNASTSNPSMRAEQNPLQEANLVLGELPNASTSNLTVLGMEQNFDGLPKPPATKKRKRATKASVVKDSDKIMRLKKSLNLNTYKNHSLGDYTEAIRRYGTVDSYSTESVLCSHF